MNYLQKTDYTAIPDGEVAAAVMAELEWHKQQDAFVQGQYWEKGKGCAVGCLLKNSNHAEYEPAFGIPIMLAHLEDRLFEGLTFKPSKKWPISFMGACMNVGNTRAERMQKLSAVGWEFLHWLLVEELPKSVVGEGEIYDNVRKAIAKCADAISPLTRGEKFDKDAAHAAAYAAADAAADAADDAAAYAAADAAADAADAADDAADDAAAYAARAAAYAAADAAARAAARAAADVACAAAHAAAHAAAGVARVAVSATRADVRAAACAAADAAYERMADKLIELIKGAK